MKRPLPINISLFVWLSLFILSACSGGGGGDSTVTTKTADNGTVSTLTTLTGTVADGYLRDARVFLDRNGNRLYDNGEPTAFSAAGGGFSLEVNPGEGDLYPVIVQVIAGKTVDEDTGSPVTENYLLEAPPGHWGFVSPLTTLVKLERDKNPSLTEQQAVLNVRSQLGIVDDVSLFSDYMASSGVVDAVTAEYLRTHKVAQVVANLMGRLRTAILQNLGGQIADAEQKLVAYMISDQILGQADVIKQALDNERNLGLVADVSTMTVAVSGKIDTAGLNADLLVLYEQRLEQNFELWDMQPPQVLSQFPPAADTASVDTGVSASFDEALDETLLNTSLLELSGPNGLVSGNLGYDVEHKSLTFTPDELLLPFSSYQVVLKGTLADSLGNSIGTDITWTFTTIFNETPPPLPNF